jgi:hypothetical protein
LVFHGAAGEVLAVTDDNSVQCRGDVHGDQLDGDQPTLPRAPPLT